MRSIAATLVLLYPRSWRRRYGDELRDMLSAEPLSLRTVTDVIAGAIDARLNPHLLITAQTNGRENTMGSAIFRCVPVAASREDQFRSAAWLVGGSFVLAVAALGIMYFIGSNSLSEALLWGALPAAFMFSNECTYFRRYSRAARLTMALGGGIAVILLMWASVIVAYAI